MDKLTPSARADKQRALANVVSDALVVATELDCILTREKTSLISQDVADIDAAVAAKHAAASELEILEQRRRALCDELTGSATPGADEMTSLLDGCDYWQRYCDRMRRCHDANAINGRLVHLRRRHVTRALQILSGGHAVDAGAYGPKAGDAFTSRSQVLGSA